MKLSTLKANKEWLDNTFIGKLHKELMAIEDTLEEHYVEELRKHRETLKPCPMCGGEAKLLSTEFVDMTYGYYVCCLDCDIKTGAYSENKNGKMKAIKTWNKRSK